MDGKCSADLYTVQHVGKSRAERSRAAIVEVGSRPKIVIVGFYYKHLFALSYSLPQQINTLKRGTFPKRRRRHRGVLLPLVTIVFIVRGRLQYFPRPLADSADMFCVLYLHTAQKKHHTKSNNDPAAKSDILGFIFTVCLDKTTNLNDVIVVSLDL